MAKRAQLTMLVVILQVAACGKSPSAPPSDRPVASLRSQFEHVLAAVPPVDAPEQKCPDAEIAKRATDVLARQVVLLHIDRLRELVGKKAPAPSGAPHSMRNTLSNATLEMSGLPDPTAEFQSQEIEHLLESRPFLLVTEPLKLEAASAGAEGREFVSGEAAVRISLYEPGTGRVLCWTTAHAKSSDRVVTVAGNEADSVQRDLDANIFLSIGPALARIAPALKVADPPWE